MKNRKRSLNDQPVFFGIQQQSLGLHHVSRRAVDAEKKLQISHYDDEKDWWDWDKYVELHKEQHIIMESLADHSHSGIASCTKAHTFFKESEDLSWR